MHAFVMLENSGLLLLLYLLVQQQCCQLCYSLLLHVQRVVWFPAQFISLLRDRFQFYLGNTDLNFQANYE
jgi:hypothetical protein